MFKKFFKGCLLFLLIVSNVSLAIAQRQTGIVSGKAVDAQGVQLPGVSVSLRGPALMGVLNYLTTTGGDFRFPAVPPGKDYVLTAELAGFRTLIKEGIIVSVGKTFSIVLPLETATIEKEIQVTAAAPTVDIKSSKISLNYSSDLISKVPLSRDYYDVIKTIPGVISEGDGWSRGFSSSGGAARTNKVALDGINLQDSLEGGNPISIPFDTIDEVEFELGFHPAEIFIADGAYVNIVSKSGGNTLHGNVNLYYFNKSMTKSTISEAEAETAGLSVPQGAKRWGDYGFSLGGPVITDKLWFFANARYVNWALEDETFADGVVEAPHTEPQTFLKLTFNPHPQWRISAGWKYTHIDELIANRGGLDYFQAVENTLRIDGHKDSAIVASAQWFAGQNSLLDLRFNYVSNFDPQHIQPYTNPNSPTLFDLFTGMYSGPGVYSQDIHNKRYLMALSWTQYLDSFLGGNHEFKGGLDYEKNLVNFDPFKSYPVIHFTFNGSPWAFGPGMGMLVAFTVGANPGDMPVKPDTWRLGGYVQDSFSLWDRLTFNLGVRYDESHGNIGGMSVVPALASNPAIAGIAPEIFTAHDVPAASDIIVWKAFSPRIGLVFDIFGDKKSTLKASWARYSEPLIMEYYYMTSPYPDALQSLWLDLNMNGDFDVDDAYIPIRLPRNPSTFDPKENVDPSLKIPRTDEFIVGLEREILKDFSLSLNYIYKNKSNIVESVERYRGNDPNGEWWIPYTVADPGPDGQFETGDDSSITVYAVGAGAPASWPWLSNPRAAKRKYNALEFIFQKRMSNRWQLLGSVTLSKFEGNLGAGFGFSGGHNGQLGNPNGYVNSYGRLDMDRPLQIKLQGSVVLPLEFTLGAYFFHMSGIPYNRTLEIYFPSDPGFDPSNPSYVKVNAEAPGSGRHQTRTNLDLRLEKAFSLGKVHLGMFLDVLNVLGENWFDIYKDAGGIIAPDGSFTRYPAFGTYIGANGLRVFKASVQFSF